MSVWPAWEVQERESTTSWFTVRLDLPNGALVDVLAVAAGGCVAIEEVRAEPPLSLDDLAALADRIEEPLLEACGFRSGPSRESAGESEPPARPDMPRGIEEWRLVAEEYRAAQERGADPVLAVMCATGYSRRRSLKLIGSARDAGLLAPRHVRR
ncbi:DUF6214 family protein [Streptomyces colonosanans]|uniref:Uncharacterized protein n=1 Tax=Streptomyces colonosanans TaxID=1428652 RepID=A0A1S2PQD8_9ACTN|nr:DUF6214 family protein [Streptomyces colonosanans]OIJ96021.1 hypothetical protein BIV24_08205 [Streptomyces colonosanans]